MSTALLLAALISVAVCPTKAGHDWCYTDPSCGPSTWAEKYQTCGGSRQSPINIKTASTNVDPALTPLILEGPNLYKDVEAKVENNGHSFDVTLRKKYTLSGAALPATFRLKSFHFHFGAPGVLNKGSEHLINNGAYLMEMHLVFYNTQHKSAKKALKKRDGLAVLGVFFQIGAKNKALNTIISQLSDIRNKNQSSAFLVNLADLLPQSLLPHYYRYKGSLTTPPCTENVIWTVLAQPLQMSQKQYDTIIRSLSYSSAKSRHQVPMQNNYRPVQPLNGRVVSRSPN